MNRVRLKSALSKPTPESENDIDVSFFEPWSDGIYGSYASESGALMIEALRAVRDRTAFDDSS